MFIHGIMSCLISQACKSIILLHMLHIIKHTKNHHLLTDYNASKVWDDLAKQALVETSTGRVLLCGKYLYGKSSLANSLLHDTPYTCRTDDRTRVLNYHSWKIDSDTTVPIFDLGGHVCY